MCEQLQMNNQSLTGDPVGAEVCRRSRLGIANDMCGIASHIFGAGKSVLFSFFYRHSKRMYFSSTGRSSCVCSVFFVDFPKECIIPLWSFRLCLSTFQNIFRTRKPFHFLSALTLTFAHHFRSGDLSALACTRKKIVLPNRCSIGCGIPLWSFCLCLSTFQNIFRSRKTISCSVCFDFDFCP